MNAGSEIKTISFMSSNYTDHGGCWGKRAPIIQQFKLKVSEVIIIFSLFYPRRVKNLI